MQGPKNALHIYKNCLSHTPNKEGTAYHQSEEARWYHATGWAGASWLAC